MGIFKTIGQHAKDTVAAGFAGNTSALYDTAQEAGGSAADVATNAAGEPLTDDERSQYINQSWVAAEKVGPALLGGVTFIATGGNVDAAKRVAGMTSSVTRWAQTKNRAGRGEIVPVTETKPWSRNLWPRSPRTIQRQVDRTLRALIDVESDGDPNAVNPNGKFFGLLQMGAARASDVGIDDPRQLLGDPELAVLAWYESMQQDSNVHQWIPPLMALSWKGGAGTLKRFMRMVFEDGTDARVALETVQPSHWRIPQYMSAFARAYQRASR